MNRPWRGAAPAIFDSATTAWVNAVVAAGGSVGATLKTAVDTFIKSAKATGEWSILDRFWVFCADEVHGSLIDIVALATATNHSATFTANQGYTGDGAAAYIDTNFTPATAGGNATLNGEMIFAYDLTNRTVANAYGLMGSDAGGSTFSYLLALYAGGVNYLDISGATNISESTVTTARGAWLGSRTSGTNIALYRNGSSTPLVSSGANASTAQGNRSYVVLANTNGTPQAFTTDQCAFAAIGGAFTATNAANLMNYANTLATVFGINVY